MRGESLLNVGHDGLLSLLAIGLLARGEFLHLGLGGADGQALLDDETGDLHAMGGAFDTEQGLGMAGGKLALADVALELLVEREKTDAVGDRGTGLAEAVRDGVLRQLEVVHQLGDADGLFDGVEVGALQVLDESQDGAGVVLGVKDAGGDGLLADQLEGAETALAGDDLVAVLHLADDDRLHEALGADRVGEFLHLRVVEVAAGLMGVRDDGSQRQFLQQQTGSDRRGDGSGSRCSDRRRRRGSGDRHGGLGHAASDEGTETATEGFLGRSGHGAFEKGQRPAVSGCGTKISTSALRAAGEARLFAFRIQSGLEPLRRAILMTVSPDFT